MRLILLSFFIVAAHGKTNFDSERALVMNCRGIGGNLRAEPVSSPKGQKCYDITCESDSKKILKKVRKCALIADLEEHNSGCKKHAYEKFECPEGDYTFIGKRNKPEIDSSEAQKPVEGQNPPSTLNNGEGVSATDE